MSAEEYRQLLEETGYSQQRFAVLVGTNKRTGQKWALGESRIPGCVALLLRLLQLRPEMKTVVEGLGALPPRARSPKAKRGRAKGQP
jgi:transcriptional regulator with XRE-family HTH domain